MNKWLDILVPRFITEWVALVEVAPGEFDILCCANDLYAGERPDGMAVFRSFTFLGIGLFPRCVSEVISWEKYQELATQLDIM